MPGINKKSNPHAARPVILIGFRGTGKTAIGKRLAERLRLKYISTDEMIEQRTGMMIRDFVEQNGWDKFRDIERTAIEEVTDILGAVIDCGGGVIEDAQNMERLWERGIVVWVDAEVEDILARLSRAADRPLLNQADLKTDVERNYARRLPLYRRYAQIQVNSSRESVDEICDRIIVELENM
ncbi:MAG: shikimate kinase [Calditrichia bacterium]